jgi:hypothetical protein
VVGIVGSAKKAIVNSELFFSFVKKNACHINVLWYHRSDVSFDDKRHSLPHIHAEYQGEVAVVDIETAEKLAGEIPPKKLRLVQAWIEIHRDELMDDWKLASEGKETFKIKPLE